jgi:hypothetical protein
MMELTKMFPEAFAVTENRKFSTGAERSTDADTTRYDLITPIGLARVAAIYRDGFSLKGENLTPSELVGLAQDCAWAFLGGDRGDLLALSAIYTLEAIGAVDGWVPPESRGRGRGYELIPVAGLRRVAKAYALGAIKYEDFNWEKGMPVGDLLNHGLKHLQDYLDGKIKEDDLGHAAWNFLSAIHSHEMWPQLNSNLRGPGCVPPVENTRNTEKADQDPGVKPLQVPDISRKIPSIRDALNGDRPYPVLYISGPMTGIADHNFPAFHVAADALRAMGFPVLNPADFGENDAYTWADYLQRDLTIMGYADIVVQLPGWEHSRGACLEYQTAVALSKGVVGLSDLVRKSS